MSKNLATPSIHNLGIQIEKAKSVYLWDDKGKKYFDFISGIAVSNIGHRHPKVIGAIKRQMNKYLHLMVYGELSINPQQELAILLCRNLPAFFDKVFLVNTGSEAIETAIKLSRRINGRGKIASFKSAYHGSTLGALSIQGNEFFKNKYRPLLPGTELFEFNNIEMLNRLDENFSAVIIEPVQGEAGVIPAKKEFLVALREKCNHFEIQLVFDEIQTGMGRTGELFAFQKYNVQPDILVLAKALGGGLPLGAVVSNNKQLNLLSTNPELGHITTFGGHPLSCVAAIASLNVLTRQKWIQEVKEKENLFYQHFSQHKGLKIRSAGMMMAIEFESFEINQKIIQHCLNNGVLTDWFLFNQKAMRLAPPLCINNKQFLKALSIINEGIRLHT